MPIARARARWIARSLALVAGVPALLAAQDFQVVPLAWTGSPIVNAGLTSSTVVVFVTSDATVYQWTAQGVQSLGTISGPQVSQIIPYGFADDGAVVGTCAIGSGPYPATHGFLWVHGQWSDIGCLAGFGFSQATVVNAAHQVAGWTSVLPASTASYGGTDACRYANGTLTDLGNLGGVSEATAINAAGDIAGTSTTSATDATPHLVLWRPGAAPVDYGDTPALVAALNAGDQIAGAIAGPGGQWQATLWSGTTPIALPVPANGMQTAALCLDDAGNTLCSSWTTTGARVSLVPAGATSAEDLTTVIHSGLAFDVPQGLNAQGAILVQSCAQANGPGQLTLLLPTGVQQGGPLTNAVTATAGGATSNGAGNGGNGASTALAISGSGSGGGGCGLGGSASLLALALIAWWRRLR